MNRSSSALAAILGFGLWAIAASGPAAGGTPLANQGVADLAIGATSASQPDVRDEIRNLCRTCLARQEAVAKTLAAAQAAAKAGNAQLAGELTDGATSIIAKMQEDVTAMKAASARMGVAFDRPVGYSHNADYTKLTGRLVGGDVETGLPVIEFAEPRSTEQAGDKYRGRFVLLGPGKEGKNQPRFEAPPAMQGSKTGDWVEITGQPAVTQRTDEPSAAEYEVTAAKPLAGELAARATAKAGFVEVRNLCQDCQARLDAAAKSQDMAKKALAGGDNKSAATLLRQTGSILGVMQGHLVKMREMLAGPTTRPG